MPPTVAKEIADGLMRAKQLEVIRLRNCKDLDSNQMIYNLAFSPKIRVIDLNNNGKVNNDTVEALFKLLKISGSIQVLDLGETSFLNVVSEDFSKALGENKTLEYINVSRPMSDRSAVVSGLQRLFKGIAFNAMKNGSLTEVIAKNILSLTGTSD